MDLKPTGQSQRSILDSDTGEKLKNVPANQLNKTSRKVGVKNPKQKVAVALKLSGASKGGFGKSAFGKSAFQKSGI